ncbi:MAG: hypothetical protein RR410_00225 [Alistipes sp.]
MRSLIFLLFMTTLVACKKDSVADGGGKPPPPVAPDEVITYGNESLVVIDPAGAEIGFDYPVRRDKKVGIFYFIWQGAHGYDQAGYHNGDILPPEASDVNSPYDISELERGHSSPQEIHFGPKIAMHHWGKPALDYYVGNDRWVIRRHAQMLAEAGVDVIFIDLTNGFSYLPVVKTLCEVYAQMLREKNPRPQISFVLNANAATVIDQLQELYLQSQLSRLWYELGGKPLILAPLENYGAAIDKRYTIRYAWFDSQFGHGGQWYGNGLNKWTWGEFSPQRNVVEQMSVMAGSHAHLNIGRSYTGASPAGMGGYQPANTTPEQQAAGSYFKQQFRRAIACDPDMIFVTGWNEWVAQRQINGEGGAYCGSFLGKPIGNGDTYFVDCYNQEYSRDVEPCANGIKDTYYYYMVDNLRRYKGVEAVAPVAEIHKIDIDGQFDDWTSLGTRYRDYTLDTQPRDHWGFGYRNRHLTNTTGRNDISYAKVATDATMLYFYVETIDPITPHTDKNWMRLFIGVKGSEAPAWEGFQWVINHQITDQTQTQLQRCTGGWRWEKAATLHYAVNKNRLEIAVPLATLGITDPRQFTVDFKWIDNSVTTGDISDCMRDGDSAPDNRYRYRYIFKY